MAPIRKTKGVNKRFPYINKVASNKYGDNANKNKQKERSDSEQNCIDNAGTPRKPQKLARGKLRNDTSKGLEQHILDISQSRSIASDGCLSLLKSRRTDEDSSFDASLTLADPSLRMPEATAEMESSALVEEENFNIAKKSKLKRNPSVTMVEDTALKTSQLGKLKEGVQQSDTGIQKRKQKSPVKVVTVLTLESQIRDLQAQLATTRARFAHEEAQQEQSLAALEVLSQNLAQAREAAQQAEHAAVQAGFHLDDHLLRLSYVARRL
ncbi:hypothetical protein RchiOBHm_Chr4g0421571 [Rosa chinensis]|uniref:Uncharacterized protein n=1 Tax=Rosa chinensis TaxID=74649 RepID=A0A2P6QY76_ROSCH|nr:hypothetical protein RchiOBHm_Chr4g0421571 [Rosa chinensis]